MAFIVAICIAELLFILFLIKKSYLIYQELCRSAYEHDKEKRLVYLCQRYLMNQNVIKEYMTSAHIQRIAIYGIGEVYAVFKQELMKDVNVRYCIDKYSSKKIVDGKNVVNPADIPKLEPVDAILVTAVGFYEEIKEELQRDFNISIPIIDIEEVMNYDQQKRL